MVPEALPELYVKPSNRQISKSEGMIVEVFKTNVTNPDHADNLVDQIHHTWMNYRANFDLEDCDKILRVACRQGMIDAALLIRLLKEYGFHAQVLPDDIPPAA